MNDKLKCLSFFCNLLQKVKLVSAKLFTNNFIIQMGGIMKILVVTHDSLAAGFKDALSAMIAIPEQLHFVSFTEFRTSQLKQDILNHLGIDNEILFLCDLPDSPVTIRCHQVSSELKLNSMIVTGVNLGMLLRICQNINQISLNQLTLNSLKNCNPTIQEIITTDLITKEE